MASRQDVEAHNSGDTDAHRGSRTVFTAVAVVGLILNALVYVNGSTETSPPESTLAPITASNRTTAPPNVVQPTVAASRHFLALPILHRPPPNCTRDGDDPPPALLVMVGRPAGRSIENAVRAVGSRFCPYVVSVQHDDACNASDDMTRPTYDSDDLAWLAAGPLGACSEWPRTRPLKFPLRYFGFVVDRVCVTADAHNTVVVALQAQIGGPAVTFQVDVSTPSTYHVVVKKELFGTGHKVEVVATPCQDDSNVVLRQRRYRHITELRHLIRSRDAFGLRVPFHHRNLDTVAVEELSAIDGPQRRAKCASPQDAESLTVAVTVTGLVRTLRRTVPQAVLMLTDTPGIDWAFIAAVSSSFPLSGDHREGLRVLAMDPHTAAMLVMRTDQYPTSAFLELDHPSRGQGYKSSSGAQLTVRSVQDVLIQFATVSLGVMLRSAFEAHCGQRYDITIRMRTDSYLMWPMASWGVTPFSDAMLWIDKDRDPDAHSLNDQFWIGPAWLVDPLADVYFYIPDLVAAMKVFHAETLVAARGRSSGVAKWIRRPKRRIAELHRHSDDPVGLRHDQLERRSKHCNRTHCSWPEEP